MFVLQIGSISQTDSCNTNLSDPNTVDKAVLLQYSVNNGITWQVIAQHQPKDFIQAQRVSYNVPLWVPSHISLPLSAQDIFLLRKNLSLHHCARKNVDERVNKEENLRGRLTKKFQPSVYQYTWKKNRILVLKMGGGAGGIPPYLCAFFTIKCFAHMVCWCSGM